MVSYTITDKHFRHTAKYIWQCNVRPQGVACGNYPLGRQLHAEKLITPFRTYEFAVYGGWCGIDGGGFGKTKQSFISHGDRLMSTKVVCNDACNASNTIQYPVTLHTLDNQIFDIIHRVGTQRLLPDYLIWMMSFPVSCSTAKDSMVESRQEQRPSLQEISTKSTNVKRQHHM
ncbi:hypothetical protein CBL_07404 [Carabus blaptoides fortunei]